MPPSARAAFAAAAAVIAAVVIVAVLPAGSAVATGTNGTPTNSATTSPLARPAYVTPRAVTAAAHDYASTRNYHVGIAVRDLRTGRMWGSGSWRGTFASESVVKVFIATRLLVSGQMHGRTKQLAYKMITRSDDSIASSLYGRVGGDSLINWVKHEFHVWDLGTRPRHAGWWGNTHITPIGMVKLYAKLAKDPQVGPWLLHAMRNAHKYGSDGTYQYFGLPSATHGAAIKQGWGCDYTSGCDEADFNSTGFIEHHRYAVAILMRGPLDTYGAPISKALTGVARHLLPHGTFPLAAPVVTRVSSRRTALAGGTRVTVHGRNFGKVTGVRFGDRTAHDVTVLSQRRVRVTVPGRAHPRQVYVRVATASGVSSRGRAPQLTYLGAPVVTAIAPPSAASTGGRRITLTGRNFRGVRRVTFGSAVATHVHVDSPTTMHLRVPAHASGTVHVKVHGRWGTSAPRPFDYGAPPTVTAVSPTSGPAGTTVTITGTGFTHVRSVTFGSAAATVADGGTATSLTVTAPAHAAGLVNVHVITDYGSSGKSTADEFTYTGTQARRRADRTGGRQDRRTGPGRR